MKSILIIAVFVAATMSLALGVSRLAGAMVRPIDPVIAGVIAIVAGSAGMLPVLLGAQEKGFASTLLAALGGTVVHLVVAIVAVVAILALHAVDVHGAFAYWMVGAYWASLAALIWQLRRLLLSKASALKLQIPTC